MSSIGKWLVWLVGLFLIAAGGNAAWRGLDIVQVERGWSAVIAGTTVLSAGVIMMGIGVLIDRVDALRRALLELQAEPARRRATPMIAEAPAEEPAPPAPIEIPVEPLPTAPSAPASLFGRRPTVIPLTTPPEPPPDEPELPLASQHPEDISAAALAQPEIETPAAPFVASVSTRRPLWARSFGGGAKDRSVEAPAVVVATEPEEPQALVAEEPAEEPSFATPPIEPMPEADLAAFDEIPAVEHEPAAETADVVHLPKVPPFRPLPEEPPAPVGEPAIPPGDRHEWLEKALAGEDDVDPALDWLRSRREPSVALDPPKRRLPGFMRRREHISEEPSAAPLEDVAAAPTEPPAAAPSVVGRYSAHGSNYTLYADGSIDAETPEGPLHFGSMAELRAHLEARNLVVEP